MRDQLTINAEEVRDLRRARRPGSTHLCGCCSWRRHLLPLHRGVYAVGPGAVLSHTDGAALHGAGRT